MGLEVVAVDRACPVGRHPVHRGARSVKVETLSPVVEGDAPGIRDGNLEGALELAALGVEAGFIGAAAAIYQREAGSKET